METVADAIAGVLPKHRPIGHHDAHITAQDAAFVADALIDFGSHQYVKLFENELKARCEVQHVCAVSSGTCALQLALLAAGVKPGDEVIVPSLTFAGTANAICNVGAVPHFVDSDLYGMKPYYLQRHLHEYIIGRRSPRKITAMIAVHVLGFPCDMEALRTVADRFSLTLVEDAAQALGSTLQGRPCGSLGHVSILSFNNNKTVTTNGGGAVLSRNPWIVDQAKKLATTARVPHRWLIEHDAIAFNYRMGDINAALGLSQLRRLETILARKADLFRAYSRGLHGLRSVELVDNNAARNRVWNHWLNAIKINRATVDAVSLEDERDALLLDLHTRGIFARCLSTPLHRLPQFKNFPRSDIMMPMADDAWRRTICLPSGPGLVEAGSDDVRARDAIDAGLERRSLPRVHDEQKASGVVQTDSSDKLHG